MSSRPPPDREPAPKFSLVVVSYNSRDNLPACMESVERAFTARPGDAELIVVDNASRDGTGTWLTARARAGTAVALRPVLNGENTGFSRACNQGARLARGTFLLFLNPDALLTPNACERMALAFADGRTGAVGPVSNYVAGLQRLDLHWPAAAGTLESLPGKTAWEKAVHIDQALDRAHTGSYPETRLLIGFCLMTPRELFLSMGGFDEDLFLGNDDLELSWRLRERGHRLVVACGVFVFHEGQKSFRTEGKTTVDRLVQESTDVLFRKLALHYGGDAAVPPPEELWGIGWFKPSPAAYGRAPLHPKTAPENSMPNALQSLLPDLESATKDGLYLNYPETLRGPLQEAERSAFAGTAVASIPQHGRIAGVDGRGKSVPLENQDLLILRVSPDMVRELPQRLRNLREQMPRLRRLIAVLDSRQALGLPPHPRGFEVTVDVTAEGVSAALRLAGFQAGDVAPYPGFPGAPAAAPRVGWWQIEAVPRPAAHSENSLVSIIILGFNQVAYTKQCVESIRRNTRQRHELILVDNGSKDGTWEYFQGIPGAVTIRNPENRGVAAGWNQGLRKAQGDYLLVLNNDTLIFPGMIENMVRLCAHDSGLGVAGPRCNRIAAAQAVDGVNYRAVSEMETFARDWQNEHELAWAEYDWIKGTCMLIPRSAFEKIGLFDERYGKGNFEDDDYCLRARYHGFRTAIAHDSYLHHFGSVSFGQENVDWNALMRENQIKFENKWKRGAAALADVVISREETSRPALDLVAQGSQAYASGDLDRAGARFSKAVEMDPANAEALSALGVLAFHKGDHREAVLLSMRSLLYRPEDPDTARNLLEGLTALNGAVSPEERAAMKKRFPENPAWDEGKPAPSWVPAPAAQEGWKTEVESLIRAERYTEALDRLEPKFKAKSDVGACQNYLGVIAMACHRPDEALGYFRQAVHADPNDSDFVLNLAETLVCLEQPDEASRVLDQSPVSNRTN